MGLPTSDEFINDEERRTGIKLPQTFRTILRLKNGGEEVCASGDIWNLYAVKDTSSRKHISRSANHIERETHQARLWEGFPPNAVAIAENGTGDLLILFKDNPDVFVWHHESGLTEVAAFEF